MYPRLRQRLADPPQEVVLQLLLGRRLERGDPHALRVDQPDGVRAARRPCRRCPCPGAPAAPRAGDAGRALGVQPLLEVGQLVAEGQQRGLAPLLAAVEPRGRVGRIAVRSTGPGGSRWGWAVMDTSCRVTAVSGIRPEGEASGVARPSRAPRPSPRRTVSSVDRRSRLRTARMSASRCRREVSAMMRHSNSASSCSDTRGTRTRRRSRPSAPGMRAAAPRRSQRRAACRPRVRPAHGRDEHRRHRVVADDAPAGVLDVDDPARAGVVGMEVTVKQGPRELLEPGCGHSNASRMSSPTSG